MFRYGVLAGALGQAVKRGLPVTDESSAVEFSGKMPLLVEGRPDNIKITVPADLELAGFILSRI
jgi:2-C-methyl-D-erythritol 4-phosphate cytidylyltransferase